ELTSNVIDRLRIVAREHRVGIVVGLSGKSSYGFLYNSLIAIDDRGEIYAYRKRHLPTFSVFDEARWFRSYKKL
ncbi:MAG TPA: carbon-nitrogen hydrolase family protein, partial [Pyrodictiaceae archaeon]|nr:carbon-nitrogen hydrolase family protein [Pyrodictiaceae archaeon]